MTNLERLFRKYMKFSATVVTYLIWNLPEPLEGVSGGELYNWLLEEEVAPPVAADGAGKDES